MLVRLRNRKRGQRPYVVVTHPLDHLAGDRLGDQAIDRQWEMRTMLFNRANRHENRRSSKCRFGLGPAEVIEESAHSRSVPGGSARLGTTDKVAQMPADQPTHSHDGPYQLDTETALTATGSNQWSTELCDAWSIGENLNGGYLMAPLVRAMASQSGHPHPLSVTTHFLRPGRGGSTSIEVEPIRSGRTIGTVRGRLAQAGKTKIESIAAFTSLDNTAPGHADSHLDLNIEPIDMPPPDVCVDRRSLEQGIDLPIMQRLDIRVHPNNVAAGQSDTAEVAGWIRFSDGRPVDPFALTLFADAFPPPLFAMLGYIGWVPTIELTVHVRRLPKPGWILGHFRTREAAGNRMIEDGTLWDESGLVVAQSRQVGLILQGEPLA